MTAGTAGAVTTAFPAVEQHIDGERFTVTVDFTSPDVLTLLARALRRVGLMRTFATLGTAEGLLAEQLRALLSEPSIRDALTVTLSPEAAEDFGRAVDEATLASPCDRCGWRYATAEGLCNVCHPEVEP